MANTPLRHRIFAGFGAALFLITASTLTIGVVVDMFKSKDTNTTSTAACTAPTNVGTLDVPEVFKPTGAVNSLETKDLAPGDGDAAKDGDCLIVKYYGTLASDGTMFDENFTKSDAFAFTLGAGQVIKGWDQGMVGLKAGGERRLVIPAILAYGEQGQGSIPANSDLVFVVKLLEIQK